MNESIRVPLTPQPNERRFCPKCGLPQQDTIKEDRSPMEQWECAAGHSYAMFGRREEGEV